MCSQVHAAAGGGSLGGDGQGTAGDGLRSTSGGGEDSDSDSDDVPLQRRAPSNSKPNATTQPGPSVHTGFTPRESLGFETLGMFDVAPVDGQTDARGNVRDISTDLQSLGFF